MQRIVFNIFHENVKLLGGQVYVFPTPVKSFPNKGGGGGERPGGETSGEKAIMQHFGSHVFRGVIRQNSLHDAMNDVCVVWVPCAGQIAGDGGLAQT